MSDRAGSTPMKALLWRTLVFTAFAVLVKGVLDSRGSIGPQVFGSYWTSGWAFRHGLDPYAALPGIWQLDARSLHIADVNLNPPILLPFFAWISRYPMHIGVTWWLFASSGIYGIAAGSLAMRARVTGVALGWLFLSPLVLDTLLLGQIYTALFALSAAAWFLRDRPAFAGILIGIVVALKPTFIIWPALLACGGHWRPAVSAAFAAVVLSGLGLLLCGPEAYIQWLAALHADTHVFVPTEASITGYFTRVGLPLVGHLTAAALMIIAAAWLWRRRLDLAGASRIGLLVAILASPLAWPHYTLLAIPWLVSRPWNRRRIAGAILLSVPPHLVLTPPHPALSCLYLAATSLWLLAELDLAGLAPRATPLTQEASQAVRSAA